MAPKRKSETELEKTGKISVLQNHRKYSVLRSAKCLA